MAKRWKDSYNEGDIEEKTPFWNYISKHVINEDHHINSKLYNAFTYVITQLGKQYAISVVQTGKKYYSTLMMHSFAAKKECFLIL